MRTALRTTLTSLGFSLVLLGLGVTAAQAHNSLENSSPSAGESLATAPDLWVLNFEKVVPLKSASGAIIDGDGVRIPLAQPMHGQDDTTILFAFPPNLQGSISARWRLVGTDGHVISGRIAFSINVAVVEDHSQGDIPDTIPEQSSFIVDDNSLQDESMRSITPMIRVMLRLLNFVFLLIFGGILFCELFIARGTLGVRRAGAFLTFAGVGNLFVPLAQLWILSRDLGGSFMGVVSTTPGVMTAGRTAPAAALLVGIHFILKRRISIEHTKWHLGFLWLLYLMTLAYVGHSRSQDLPWLGIPVDIIHVSAITVWLGGLATLLILILPTVEPDVAVDCFRRFSRFAFTSVIVVALTGVVQTWRLHASLGSLIKTEHGLLLLLKVVLVALIITFAARNRLALQSEGRNDHGSSGSTRRLVAKSAISELVLATTVLAITSILVGTSLE